jgi:hypothetical protein
MKKMKDLIARLFRRLIASPDYRRYDPPFPGDGI